MCILTYFFIFSVFITSTLHLLNMRFDYFFQSSNNPIEWNEDNAALNNFGEPSVWLNNTQDDLLKSIWFDHQKSLTGYDSFFGNASSELGKVIKDKRQKTE